MKTFSLLPLLFVPVFLSTASVAEENRKPVKIIFDTDMGNDVDDAMALAVAHALVSRNEMEILAVTSTKDNPHVAPILDVLNTFYGRPEIPIGVVQGGVTKEDGKYNAKVLDLKNASGSPLFPRKITAKTPLPEAVSLLRKILAEQEDQSIVVVQIGFFTNFARLLETKGDDISPLSGKELVARKVRYASIMAGAFEEPFLQHKEYNVVMDLPAARKFIELWPVEIIFSGYEVGTKIQYPAVSIDRDFSYVPAHPVRESYGFYRGFGKDQPTYDLNSVLYAARPDRGYYTLSEPGTVSFTEEGKTLFKKDPNGKHRYQIVDPVQTAVVREALVQLTSQPPQHSVK